jgi:caa(3)-type oxidase subunit IV
MEANKSAAMTRGLIIFGVLAILTIAEWLLAQPGNLVPLLIVVALVKAGLVIWYYMHVRRVFGREEAH